MKILWKEHLEKILASQRVLLRLCFDLCPVSHVISRENPMNSHCCIIHQIAHSHLAKSVLLVLVIFCLKTRPNEPYCSMQQVFVLLRKTPVSGPVSTGTIKQHFQIRSGISERKVTLWRCHCKFPIYFIYFFTIPYSGNYEWNHKKDGFRRLSSCRERLQWNFGWF